MSCKITASEIVNLVKDPESKLIVRRVLNLLQSEDTLNILLNDLNTAIAKSIDHEEHYALLHGLFELASIAKETIKKDKKNASIW